MLFVHPANRFATLAGRHATAGYLARIICTHPALVADRLTAAGLKPLAVVNGVPQWDEAEAMSVLRAEGEGK
jgi:hypothetical protein